MGRLEAVQEGDPGRQEDLPGAVETGRLEAVQEGDPGKPADLPGAVETGRLEAHRGAADPVVVGRPVEADLDKSLPQDPARGC